MGVGTLAAYLDEVIGQQATDQLIYKYELGVNMVGDVFRKNILWQTTPAGDFADADIIEIDEDGTIKTADKLTDLIYKEYGQEVGADVGFFGGKLAKESDIVCVVQEPLICLQLAHFLPLYTWLAVGYNRLLTPIKLDSLAGKKTRLFADDEMLEEWRELAKKSATNAQVTPISIIYAK